MADETFLSIDGLEARLAQAKDLEFQGKFADSESLATEILELSDHSPVDFDSDCMSMLLFDAYNLRGIARRMQGRRDEALRDYEEAMDYTLNDGQRALVYINMADIYRGNREFDRAKHVLIDAIGLSNPSSPSPVFPFAYVKALDQQGLVCVAEKEFGKALEHYRLARSVFDDLFAGKALSRDETKLKANILQHLAIGIEYAKLDGLYGEAFSLHAGALVLSESMRDMSGILNVVTAAARLNAQCGRHEDALALYEKAWRVVQDTDYERGKATVLLHWAHSHLALGGSDPMFGLGVAHLMQFIDATKKGAIPQGDYKVMAPYVDEVVRLSSEHGINVVGLSAIQQMFHQ